MALSNQEIETFIYQFRNNIAQLQAQQTTQNQISNQLQTSVNGLSGSTNSGSSSSSGNVAADTYPFNGGILHKLVTTFQAAVKFASTILVSGTATFSGTINTILTASKLVKTDSSSNLTTGQASLTADVSGVLPVANGGTGDSSLTAHNVLVGNGSSGIVQVAPSTSGQFLKDNGAAADPSFAGVNFTNLAGSISTAQVQTTGTFTPVLKFGGVSVGITYNIQTGVWTKIGGVTFIEINISLTSKGSSTGGATIEALPSTPSNLFCCKIAYLASMGSIGIPDAYVAGSTTTVSLTQLTSSGFSGSFDDTNFTNTSQIVIGLIYR